MLSLSLLVLKTTEPDRLVRFYERLGVACLHALVGQGHRLSKSGQKAFTLNPRRSALRQAQGERRVRASSVFSEHQPDGHSPCARASSANEDGSLFLRLGLTFIFPNEPVVLEMADIPHEEWRNGLQKFLPTRCQSVFDPGRYFGIHGAFYQEVVFKTAERTGQHFLRDRADASPENGEPNGLIRTNRAKNT
jgi:hypothetical protein